MKVRSYRLITRPNLAGLASVFLILLMMFLEYFLTYRAPYSSVPVDNPAVLHPKTLTEVVREDAIIISVRRDGRVFFAFDHVVPERLPGLIRQSIEHGSERKVYNHADKRAKYGTVKEVIDAVRASGIESIAFLADQQRPQATTD